MDQTFRLAQKESPCALEMTSTRTKMLFRLNDTVPRYLQDRESDTYFRKRKN